MSIPTNIRRNIVNVPGWKTRKKILVIESDDWGAISMPSKRVYDTLLAKGIPTDSSFFAKYDCLESEQDLALLFDVLSSFKDHKGNHPCITANTIVANPDFDKIAASQFQTYYYEPFTETYKKYPKHANTFTTWQDGIKLHLLWPQFHGREHINPQEWLKTIRTGNTAESEAFNNQTMLALLYSLVSKRKMGYLAAFDYETLEEMKEFEQVIKEGCDFFKRQFGFRSTTFVAPTSIRSDKLDEHLKANGIRFHQVGQQILPAFEGYMKKDRFWGQKNRYGQVYWRRNGKFEPSGNWHFDWIDKVMRDIVFAFRWGKPAVISSHRVNYIGGIVPQNRDNTLKLLKGLLKRVLEKYPDIEFLSSDQLGEEIIRTRKSD